MLRNYLMIVLAIAVVAFFATTASAGNLGLVDNGDMELVNRFAPWGDPEPFPGDPNWKGSTPTGRPDAWHHSATPTAVWSDPNTFSGGPHPVTSGVHALWLEDPLFGVESEFRSYAGDSGCCGPGGTFTGNLPGVGVPGRTLTFGWEWDYSIVGGSDVFSGTLRISKVAGTGLDLNDGGDPNANFTEIIINTGTGSSAGYVTVSGSIALAPTDNQFDFIFNTSDRNLDKGEVGRESARGTMFVDDVFASVKITAELGPIAAINVGNQGLIPLQLKLTDVDVSTLLVGDPLLGVPLAVPVKTSSTGSQTVLQVSTQAMVTLGVLDGNSTSLKVTGFLNDGTEFMAMRTFSQASGLAAVASIPEPASLILLGLGGVGWMFRRRR